MVPKKVTSNSWVVVVLALVLMAVIGSEVRKRVHVRAVLAWPGNQLFERRMSPAWMGDGGPALELRLFNPMGIVEGPSGDLYISDRGPFRGGQPLGGVIWRVDGEGRAHLVAGSGHKGHAEPGAPARGSDLRAPEGLAFDSRGRLHFVDTRGHRVFRIEHDGTLAVVAGTGRSGFAGDGGPAEAALLRNPVDIRIDADDNIYLTDVRNHRVRRVTPDGIIETVAGTGVPGFSGDGGLAVEAQLHDPWGIFIHPSTGHLIIGDGENHRVRKVDQDGVISTVVGTGERGYSGDGGPALEGRLDSPQSFGFDCEGRMYVGDEHNHVVRVVELDGTIHTRVGTGEPGLAMDGAVGTEAPLNDPENMHVACDGTLYITDSLNSRVVRVDPDGRLRQVVGRGQRPGWMRWVLLIPSIRP